MTIWARRSHRTRRDCGARDAALIALSSMLDQHGAPFVRSLAAVPWKRPNIGSRVNREVHARIRDLAIARQAGQHWEAARSFMVERVAAPGMIGYAVSKANEYRANAAECRRNGRQHKKCAGDVSRPAVAKRPPLDAKVCLPCLFVAHPPFGVVACPPRAGRVRDIPALDCCGDEASSWNASLSLYLQLVA
jgi:hypothetical protein